MRPLRAQLEPEPLSQVIHCKHNIRVILRHPSSDDCSPLPVRVRTRPVDLAQWFQARPPERQLDGLTQQSVAESPQSVKSDPMAVEILPPHLGRGHLALPNELPLGDQLVDGRPERPRHLSGLVLTGELDSLEERTRSVVESAEREELVGAGRERAPLHLHEAAKDRGLQSQQAGHPGTLVPMVVQHADGSSRSHCMAVEVREHLLAAGQAGVLEEDDSDRLIAQLGVLVERGLDRGPAVLAVVDEEPGRHGDVKLADPHARPLVRDPDEPHLTVDRGRERGEDIAVRVVQNVGGQGGDARLVEYSLRTQLGSEFVLVEQEEPGNQPQGAHGDEELTTCLYAPDSREDVLKPRCRIGNGRFWHV